MARSAVDALRAGELDTAEARCRQALTLEPGHIGSLAILGGVLHALARHSEALTVFEELAQREPHEPVYWMNLGTARRCAGKFDAALTAFTRAAELGARSADFYYNVGLTHLDRHDYESARAVLARALELAPQDAEIRFEYARACNESGHTEEAVTALRDWRSLPGLSAELVAKISQQLLSSGEADSAMQAVDHIAAYANSDASSALEPRAALTLAQVLERMNRLEEAAALLKRLTRHPHAAQLGADLILTEARLAQREGRHAAACNLFTQALEQLRDFHKRHFELFPLAKSLDALGRHDAAFATLQEAHESQLAHLELTAPLACARGAPALHITRFGSDPADVATWDAAAAPSLEESPIFIVAFPRSGTTLLELTLDAHPQLKSMDEQPFLQNAIDDLLAAGVRYPQELGRVDGTLLAAVRARYWERVRRKVQLTEGERLVDKNPLNLLRLAAIRRLFPQARIVLAIRHPCDVLLSCYAQHFTAPDFALLCKDLAMLARAYRKSFDFWYQELEVLKPRVLEIRYESFVMDFDRQVRNLSEFLALPWNDALLAPREHARAKGFISTPSYSQVIEPIHIRSIGRWRTFAHHFEAVMPLLRPYIERWNYAA